MLRFFPTDQETVGGVELTKVIIFTEENETIYSMIDDYISKKIKCPKFFREGVSTNETKYITFWINEWEKNSLEEAGVMSEELRYKGF